MATSLRESLPQRGMTVISYFFTKEKSQADMTEKHIKRLKEFDGDGERTAWCVEVQDGSLLPFAMVADVKSKSTVAKFSDGSRWADYGSCKLNANNDGARNQPSCFRNSVATRKVIAGESTSKEVFACGCQIITAIGKPGSEYSNYEFEFQIILDPLL